jgi:hypothetical protein
MYLQQPFMPHYSYPAPLTFPLATPSGPTGVAQTRGVNPGDSMCRNLFSSTLTPELGHAAIVQPPSSEGPLASELYAFTYPPHSDLPSVGTFGTPQSKFTDLTTFVVNFRERLRLFGYPDAVLCRLFPTCLEGPAWDWYVSLPKGSISDFATLTQRFLARFETIKKP